ncbi:hypothetical protein FIBSPDRAFT_1020784 [Athelia psychrophila]|uniref:Glutamine amidotransferase type-2 domain-containing protein n=1 Tax=Athelia psychrophila TaxID=1759441 RepID=A0A166V3V5_9AGAM|nr:hypothetical protein FIBSPDRAFT_1020784 [Fibularhizoctonia sp. CBS 109695]
MCGIVVSAHLHNHSDPLAINATSDYKSLVAGLHEATAARGPDAQNSCEVNVQHECSSQDLHVSSETARGICLDLFASELRLRGEFPVVQPHQIGSNLFCWNGEVLPNENDGIKLMEAVEALSEVERLPELLGSVEGPYAFVYYHHASQRLFYARDPLGRRSLLVHEPTTEEPYFFLSSTPSASSVSYEMQELPTKNIYCLDLRHLANSHNAHLPFVRNLPSQSELTSINRELPPDTLEIAVGLDKPPGIFDKAVDDLIYHLDRSVKQQVQNIPQSLAVKDQARVAVLFSGGIDCTILAYFASQNLPIDEPIDLLNVAFNNPRKLQAQAPTTKKKKKDKPQPANANAPSYNVPDRLTGLQEVEELRRLCPGRTWNFSLANALWFASRGIGKVRSRPDGPAEAHTTGARVLLSGLGSDELLGGYGRHRTAYSSGGWKALIHELQLELDRIPSRNLGRDDRVISSHGKETRHPFLSLSVVSFLATLPVHLKVDPRLELGVGDKILLRLAARKVGLLEASGRKKKAMQFGSHSARMEIEGKEKEKRGDMVLGVPASSNPLAIVV